jgi:hypothetical protein
MYEVVQTCNACGAGLTLDDLRATNCKYCKTVFPHHAQAAQHALVAGQMMNQMMAQQAQIQDQWRGAYGVGPMPPAAPGGMPGGPPPGMSPPPGGTPWGPPPIPGYPTNNAYGDPSRIAAAHMAQSAKLSRTIMFVVIGSIVFMFLLVGGIMAVVLMR